MFKRLFCAPGSPFVVQQYLSIVSLMVNAKPNGFHSILLETFRICSLQLVHLKPHGNLVYYSANGLKIDFRSSLEAMQKAIDKSIDIGFANT